MQGAHNRGGSDGGTALTLAQLPAHDHGLGGRYVVTDASISGGATGQLMGGGSYPAGEYPLDSQGSGQSHAHAITTDGAHSHNITVTPNDTHSHGINYDGAHTHTVTVATLPPFYALCFIMKL